MKKTSRWQLILGSVALALLPIPVVSGLTQSVTGVYTENSVEIMSALSGRLGATRLGDFVFATGSSAYTDEEDEEHALDIAVMEAKSAMIDVAFDEIAWPPRLPSGLRWELWSFYRAQPNRFSVGGVETVLVEKVDGIQLVIVGTRRSSIVFAGPSYEEIVQLIEK